MGKTILIVEDEGIVALAIKKILEDSGYDVLKIFSNYNEAIEYTNRVKPNLAIVDIKLKGEKNGIDFAQDIFDRYNVRSIFISAYSDKITVSHAKTINPYAMLRKPFNKNDLVKVVNDFFSETS